MIGESIIRAGAAALLLLGASACDPRYETIEVERVSGHFEARASGSKFTVPEGGLLVFEVDPGSAVRRDYEILDELELRTRDASVARLHQGLATGTWMLMGVEVGQTELEVHINGVLEDVIPVDVVVQEASS